jgi:hypothetical protein
MSSEEHIAELLRQLEHAEADRNAANDRADREATRANRAEAERDIETARADREPLELLRLNLGIQSTGSNSRAKDPRMHDSCAH